MESPRHRLRLTGGPSPEKDPFLLTFSVESGKIIMDAVTTAGGWLLPPKGGGIYAYDVYMDVAPWEVLFHDPVPGQSKRKPPPRPVTVF